MALLNTAVEGTKQMHSCHATKRDEFTRSAPSIIRIAFRRSNEHWIMRRLKLMEVVEELRAEHFEFAAPIWNVNTPEEWQRCQEFANGG